MCARCARARACARAKLADSNSVRESVLQVRYPGLSDNLNFGHTHTQDCAYVRPSQFPLPCSVSPLSPPLRRSSRRSPLVTRCAPSMPPLSRFRRANVCGVGLRLSSPQPRHVRPRSRAGHDDARLWRAAEQHVLGLCGGWRGQAPPREFVDLRGCVPSGRESARVPIPRACAPLLAVCVHGVAEQPRHRRSRHLVQRR